MTAIHAPARPKETAAKAQTSTVAVLQRQAQTSPADFAPEQGACTCGGGCPRCASGGPPVLPKLAVSMPGDPLEVEADRVADAVSRGEGPRPARVTPAGPAALQRACPCGGEEETCTCDEDEERPLQRSAISSGSAPRAPPSPMSLPSNGGEPLPVALRSEFEPRFGRSFEDVRLHHNARAGETARAVSALAYTVGADIVFGAGQYAPATATGRRLIAHELTHVVQQSASAMDNRRPPPSHRFAQRKDASSPTDSGPRLRLHCPLIQRQYEPNVHSPSSGVSSSVPSEKWREDAENAYRRAGFTDAANAVSSCRNWGMCDKLLTQQEAWDAYRTGRVKGNLGEAPEKTRPKGATANIAIAGMVAPVAVSGAAETAVVKTALERAALRWGAAGLVESGAALATPAAEVGVGVAAGTGAASVATVAVPIAIGVVLVLAIVDLFSYASFQVALQRQGYMILPDPLGVCIGLCHQPSAPKFPTQPRFPFPEPKPWDPHDPKDIERIRDWLDKTAPQPGPKPGPTPIPTPVPVPKPKDDEDKKKDCRLTPRTIPRGDDPLAELFCSVVAPLGRSYDIYSTAGVAEIDALSGRTWFECKCGYVSLIRALERGERWARAAIDRQDEQIRRQYRIAVHCKYLYRLVVSNKIVEEFLRARHPDIDVVRVDFQPCE